MVVVVVVVDGGGDRSGCGDIDGAAAAADAFPLVRSYVTNVDVPSIPARKQVLREKEDCDAGMIESPKATIMTIVVTMMIMTTKMIITMMIAMVITMMTMTATILLPLLLPLLLLLLPFRGFLPTELTLTLRNMIWRTRCWGKRRTATPARSSRRRLRW